MQPRPGRGPGGRFLLLGMAVASMTAVVPALTAQAPMTVWDTADDLLSWIAYPAGIPPDVAERVEVRTEAGREFVRVTPTDRLVVIAQPGGDLLAQGFTFDDLKGLPTLMDPTAQNAVRVTLRHEMGGLDAFFGTWAQRGHTPDASIDDLPAFEICDSPDDGEWHTVTLKLADSPLLDVHDDVVYMELGVVSRSFRSTDDVRAAYDRMPTSAYLDIDRIELVKLDEVVPSPTISDFYPKRARGKALVTIEGSGFGEPAERNIVMCNGRRQRVVSGDAGHLVVEMNHGGTPISVIVPGGHRAATSEPFVGIKEPCEITVVSGDGQSAPVGSVLAPFVARVVDACAWEGKEGKGVPGERVAFRVIEGQGALSVSEAITDEDGLVSSVLTLSGTPGAVRVEGKADGLVRKVAFTATAVQ